MASSKRVGDSTPAIYEVTQADAIECHACETVLPVGTWFTRHKVLGGGRANYPFCSDCEPIKLGGLLHTGRPAPPPSGYTGSPPIDVYDDPIRDIDSGLGCLRRKP